MVKMMNDLVKCKLVVSKNLPIKKGGHFGSVPEN